ncbi:MAG: hypothetical protein IJV85_01055 [Clostridia bacterium]|nr:hypothetical protein [Clostridia bacterium]
MRNKSKKILGVVAAATMLCATAFAGCGDKSYQGDALDAGYVSAAAVSSQGGFVVEKGDYVYFINGAESYQASNKYGDVVKGSLMRISKAQLSAGEYDKAQIVVPSLFVAQNFNAGVYIYGDYVYYATPTTDRDPNTDKIENSYIDFKRAKIDGTEAPMSGYFHRLSNNAAAYRFVQVSGSDKNADGEADVYCLYEDSSKLYSLNTATGENTLLVSGATGSFYYNTADLADPNVYYTMAVTDAEYNQLYTVNAAAAVTETKKVDGNYTYTVSNGKQYSFTQTEMDTAKSTAGDYTTYPYVNLGTPILDGVGESSKVTQYNWAGKTGTIMAKGYTYSIIQFANDGIYFTRADVNKTSSDAEDEKLYYLAIADAADTAAVVTRNDSEAIKEVAPNTDNANAKALFYIDGEGKHNYMYFNSSESKIYKAQYDQAVALTSASSASLWTLKGDYLYYTSSSSIYRIDYTGGKTDYGFLPTDEYKAHQLAGVAWNSSWYKPEFIGDTNTMLYSNNQTLAGTSYNYIYAKNVGVDQAALVADQELYDETMEYINGYEGDNAKAALQYYFYAEETAKFDALRTTDLYAKHQLKAFDDFVTGDKKDLKKYSYFVNAIGRMSDADQEALEEGWVNYLLKETEDDSADEGLKGWQIALIVVGSVIVVAAAALIPTCIYLKNKKAQKLEAEATVNAYKRKKIDTTDDKSIDVYATEEETVEEAEAPAEEVVEAPVEEAEAPAEEVVEAPVEETEAPIEEKTEE